MEYRELGNTGIEVSEIAFGAEFLSLNIPEFPLRFLFFCKETNKYPHQAQRYSPKQTHNRTLFQFPPRQASPEALKESRYKHFLKNFPSLYKYKTGRAYSFRFH